MAARQGRLYNNNNNNNEGGADVNYKPPNSDFEKEYKNSSGNFAQTQERFKVTEMAPEVHMNTPGIGDGAAGSSTGAWADSKPRFDTVAAQDSSYETAVSEFDSAGSKGKKWITPSKPDRDGVGMIQELVDNPTAYDTPGAFDNISNKPSVNANARPRFAETKPETTGEPNGPAVSEFDSAGSKGKKWITPSKPDRDGVGMIQELVDNPTAYDTPGAFENISNKPSVNANARPRFAETKPETTGEPSQPLVSDFSRAARNTKPSASAMAKGSRFQNTTVSYGDPGSGSGKADVEKKQFEAKMARQQAQAEAQARRAAAQYE